VHAFGNYESFIALKRARRDRGNMNRRMSFHLDRQVVCINDVFSSCAYWRGGERVPAPALHLHHQVAARPMARSGAASTRL
jgi:hypothetical protein